MTTIKHPVRVSLLAAAFGLSILTLCSRAYAGNLSCITHEPAKNLLVDVVIPCGEPAANF